MHVGLPDTERVQDAERAQDAAGATVLRCGASRTRQARACACACSSAWARLHEARRSTLQSATARGGLVTGLFILDTQSRREVYAYGLSRATAASAAVTQARSAESSAAFRTHGLITESRLIV